MRRRIRIADTLEEALEGADYVQENIGETVDVKRGIFARSMRWLRPPRILASSTSTMPASRFSEGLAGRSRCLVAHPVNPPHVVPLVELCAGAVDRARCGRAHAPTAGLRRSGAIVVKKEVEGFILNRLQAALLPRPGA